MVHITNTLDTQNLKGHCNSIVNKHPGYTESQGTLQWYSKQTPWVHRISRSTAMVQLTNTLDTENLKEHCNGIVNKHPGYTESQGALQWYS